MIRIALLVVAAWLTLFYSYAGFIITYKDKSDRNYLGITDSNYYWNPNPYFTLSEDKWGIRVWKWREFLACSYQEVSVGSNTYVKWDRDGLIEVSLFSLFDLDWVCSFKIYCSLV